jgi:hypothetical protein
VAQVNTLGDLTLSRFEKDGHLRQMRSICLLLKKQQENSGYNYLNTVLKEVEDGKSRPVRMSSL